MPRTISTMFLLFGLAISGGFAQSHPEEAWVPSNGGTNEDTVVPILNSLGLGIPEDVLIVPHVKFIGLGIDLGIPGPSLISGLKSIYWVNGALILDSQSYLRTAGGNRILAPTKEQQTQAKAWTGVLTGDLGLEQILWTDDDHRENRLGAFGYTRIRGDLRNPAADSTFALTSASDKTGNARASALAGLYFDRVDFQDSAHLKRGWQAETSLEASPSAFSLQRTEFVRWNITSTGYLPLVALTQNGQHLFSAYLAERVSWDQALSGPLPIDVTQTMGGRHPFTGVGEAVRGVLSGAGDAPLKAVSNTELRVAGPPLGVQSLYPDLTLFADAGYYADQISNPSVVASTGAVVAAHLLVMDLGVLLAWRLDDCPSDQRFYADISLGTSF